MPRWILRAYPDIWESRYKLVIKKSDGDIEETWINYTPKIFLTGEESDLKEFLRGLEASDYLVDYRWERWYKPPWYRSMKKVLVIEVPGPREYREALEWLRKDGRYRLWNTYPSDTEMMMYELGLAPSTELSDEDLRLTEDPWSMEYREPSFKRVFIRLLNWYGDVLHPWIDRPEAIQIYFHGWGEERIYRDLDQAIDDLTYYSPDVFEYLYREAYNWLRRQHPIFRDRDRVYIVYSQNVLEPEEYHGYIELSRLSKVDIHVVSRYSIGKILTTIEAYDALDLRRLIPDVRTDKEGFKTITKLSQVDRGGYIKVPRSGIYWDVAQCDYTSLYPSIIVRYNIGNETVAYRGCEEYVVAPDTRYRICMDIPATVAYTLRKLLTRRVSLKDIYRETGDKLVYARQNALKWILVTCFGYLGYRNARFGKIEAYECVTAYARETMYRAVEIAGDMGLKTIHVLVDSIWVGGGDTDTYQEYVDRVSRETGFRMELDTMYKWLYIPENRSGYGEAAVNRYVGALVDGGYKAKGIELVRRDTPPLIKNLQEAVLERLSYASDEEELIKAAREAASHIDEALDMLWRGDVDPTMLIITKKVSKALAEYLVDQPHIEAAKRLGLSNGGIVRYIATYRGAIPVERWRGEEYDRRYYLEMVIRSLDSLPLVKRYIDNLWLERVH